MNATRVDQQEETRSLRDQDRIRSCHSTTGTWYCLAQERQNGEVRTWIERVLLWALVENHDEVDHIRGIGGSGLPTLQDDYATRFVHGPDSSPFGPTWDAIYEGVKPTATLLREITHLGEVVL